MICVGAAHSQIVRRWLGRPGRALALLLLGAWGDGGIAAAEPLDCASINMGHLDAVLASSSSTLRTVEMNEGDTLDFTLRADARATGSITLVADGREQRLLHGRHGTHASYTAKRPGAVSFRLAATGGAVAIFVTTCKPARGSDATASGGLHVDMSVPLSVGATPSQDSIATATPAPPSTSTLKWLGGAQSGNEASSGTYGVNLKVQPVLMVGVLAQFDQASNPLLGPTALSDQPWLAGPVTSVQLGGGLSLDARAAWGSADPVLGHAADRQTLDARLTSKQAAGPWRFSLSIGIAHLQEKIASADVPGHTVESGRVDLVPEMAYRIDTGHSTYIEPKIMIDTFWSLGDVAATGAVTGAQHMAETGVTFGAADGTKLLVGGGVQDGEPGSDKVWTGKVQLSIPLK